MNKNRLIVGVGVYGVVAKEIIDSMKCIDEIAFIDDQKEATPTGIPVVGKTGSPNDRLSLLKKAEEETSFRITALVSPNAYVSTFAQIMPGCIVDPMAVIQSMSIIAKGCIISAGAVVNHASMCCDSVHVDCNATIAGSVLAPAGTKIRGGEVFDRKEIETCHVRYRDV